METARQQVLHLDDTRGITWTDVQVSILIFNIYITF